MRDNINFHLPHQFSHPQIHSWGLLLLLLLNKHTIIWINFHKTKDVFGNVRVDGPSSWWQRWYGKHVLNTSLITQNISLHQSLSHSLATNYNKCLNFHLVTIARKLLYRNTFVKIAQFLTTKHTKTLDNKQWKFNLCRFELQKNRSSQTSIYNVSLPPLLDSINTMIVLCIEKKEWKKGKSRTEYFFWGKININSSEICNRDNFKKKLTSLKISKQNRTSELNYK